MSLTRFFTKVAIVPFTRARASKVDENLDAVDAGFQGVAGEIDAIVAALGSSGGSGTSATSSSTLTVSGAADGSVTKTLIVEAGKFFQSGQWVTISQAGSPGNQMQCRVETYDDSNGDMLVKSFRATGSGTASSWVVALGTPYDDSVLYRAGGVMTGPITGITSDSTVKDAGAAEHPIGFRDLPANPQTAAYIIAASDLSKIVPITTGGVTVPRNADVPIPVNFICSIYNDSGSDQTITQGTSVTLRLVATSLTGNRTLRARGLATLWKKATDEWVISGPGVV